MVQFAVFSPDGKRLATASWDQTAKVWDASTGKETFTLRDHRERVTGVAFSPDGKYLATASCDSTVKIWDGRTGKELLTLRGFAGFVGCVAFSPDSKHLAVASGYRGRWEIKIWDATQWDKKREGSDGFLGQPGRLQQMVTLIQREFTVDVPLQRAWDHLARMEHGRVGRSHQTD